MGDAGIGRLDAQATLGVRVGRVALDREADRLIDLAKRCAQRALHELKNPSKPQDLLAAQILEAESKKLHAIAKLADTSDRIVRGLLAEQRERARLAVQRPEMTDEDFRRHLSAIVRELSDAEIEQ